jgi:hypothetical protein
MGLTRRCDQITRNDEKDIDACEATTKRRYTGMEKNDGHHCQSPQPINVLAVVCHFFCGRLGLKLFGDGIKGAKAAHRGIVNASSLPKI